MSNFTIAYHDQREADAEIWIKHRPTCGCCKQKIQSEKLYDIPGIGLVCEECLYDWMHYTDDYIADNWDSL